MVKHKDTEAQRHKESRHQMTFVRRLSLCLCASVSLCLTPAPQRVLNSYKETMSPRCLKRNCLHSVLPSWIPKVVMDSSRLHNNRISRGSLSQAVSALPNIRLSFSHCPGSIPDQYQLGFFGLGGHTGFAGKKFSRLGICTFGRLCASMTSDSLMMPFM